jgi:hypothetical protein
MLAGLELVEREADWIPHPLFLICFCFERLDILRTSSLGSLTVLSNLAVVIRNVWPLKFASTKFHISCCPLGYSKFPRSSPDCATLAFRRCIISEKEPHENSTPISFYPTELCYQRYWQVLCLICSMVWRLQNAISGHGSQAPPVPAQTSHRGRFLLQWGASPPLGGNPRHFELLLEYLLQLVPSWFHGHGIY